MMRKRVTVLMMGLLLAIPVARASAEEIYQGNDPLTAFFAVVTYRINATLFGDGTSVSLNIDLAPDGSISNITVDSRPDEELDYIQAFDQRTQTYLVQAEFPHMWVELLLLYLYYLNPRSS